MAQEGQIEEPDAGAEDISEEERKKLLALKPPAKPMSAYFLFASAMRKDADFQAKLAAQGGFKGNYFSEAGKEWQVLPAEDKKKYEDEAAKLKYQYQIELENFK